MRIKYYKNLFSNGLLLFFLFLFLGNSEIVSALEKKAQGTLHEISALQIPFIENKGQVKNEDVKYYTKTIGGAVFITKQGEIVYVSHKPEPDNKINQNTHGNKTSLSKKPFKNLQKMKASKGWAIKETFEGSSVCHVSGGKKSKTQVHYFKGKDPAKWKRNIPSYSVVSLGEVYRGIEIKLKASLKNVEKFFYILPGACIEDIKIRINGAKTVTENKEGDLEIETDIGAIKFTKPIAYQELEGKRQYVNASYAVRGNDYGFIVKNYDRSKKLVIDPLIASTYLGGSQPDEAFSVDIDSHGTVYVAGYTRSTVDFPVIEGSYDESHNGLSDAFIARFTNSLTELLAITYFGGSNSDWIDSICTYRDSTTGKDYIYVAGGTDSNDLPITSGAYDVICKTIDPALINPPPPPGFLAGILNDAFIAKFDADLENLVASTYLGGDDYDEALSIFASKDGIVYVAGYKGWGLAVDGQEGFPTTPGAYNRNQIIEEQSFISKLDSNLQTLLASTLLGSPRPFLQNRANSIFVKDERIGNDSVPYVYIGGWISGWIGGLQDPSSGYDAYVVKFDNALKNLIASTFVGGLGTDNASCIYVHSDGNVYVTGPTWSNDFPITSGAYQTVLGGAQGIPDAFVAKLDNNLQNLLVSTYLGGSQLDVATYLDVDFAGNAYVTGITQGDFPTTPGAPDRTYNGGTDAYLTVLDRNLTRLIFSSYLGLDRKNSTGAYVPVFQPTQWDRAWALAVDKLNNRIYVTGLTDSGNTSITPTRPFPPDRNITYNIFPVLPVPFEGYTTPSAYDIIYNGGRDAFVSYFSIAAEDDVFKPKAMPWIPLLLLLDD